MPTFFKGLSAEIFFIRQYAPEFLDHLWVKERKQKGKDMRKRVISVTGLICFLCVTILWTVRYERGVEDAAVCKINSVCYIIARDYIPARRESVGVIDCDNVYVEAVKERESLDGDHAGDEYIFRTYEGDYDRNGTKEAFVVCGKREELTKESFFGSLFFVNGDLEVQCLALAVFMDKELKFQHMDRQILVQVDYVEGIYPETDVYAVKNGEAVLHGPATMHGMGTQSVPDMDVVGEKFIPGADLSERIDAAEDFREDSYELCRTYAYRPVLLSGVSLVDATQHFGFYLLGRGIMIKTADLDHVYADIRFTSNYMVPPEIKEADFDEDGEAEFAIVTYTKHGTGLSVESLYMVDRDENGEWKMYHLPSELYCETLHEHFDTVSVEGGVRFCLDGQLIGPVDTTGEEYETEDYEYDVGDQVDFSYGHDGIKIEVEVEGIPTGGMLAIHAYPGHILSAGVEYLGSGKWRLADICYRNERIESVIEVVMRYYFEGNFFLDPEEIYHYLDKDCEIGVFERNGAEMDSLAFTYSVDEIASGIVNVKVLVYLEGEDEPRSFTVTVVKSEGDVWWNEWKVTKFY